MGDRFIEGCFWVTMKGLEYTIEFLFALFLLYEALKYLGFIQPWM